MRRSKWSYWLFLSPILIAFFMVVILPFLVGVYYSFTNWDGINNVVSLTGAKNYKALLGDDGFRQSFIFTAKFAVTTVFLINFLGFAFALLLTQSFKGTNLLRSVLFLPNLIGGIFLGFIWQFIFTKFFSALGRSLHLSWLEGWLSTSTTGFWGLVIVSAWQLSGYMMIIYIASLQGIPDSLLESAKIDGAGRFSRLVHIIMPLTAQAFTIGLFLALSYSFKLFDQNLALTAGGPYNSTQMLALNIYNTAFTLNKFGVAQGKAVIFFLMVTLIGVIQLRWSKKREVEM